MDISTNDAKRNAITAQMARIKKNRKIDKLLKERVLWELSRTLFDEDFLESFTTGRYTSDYNGTLERVVRFGYGSLPSEYYTLVSNILEKRPPVLKAGAYDAVIETDGLRINGEKVTWTQWKAIAKAVKKSGYQPKPTV